MRKGQSYTHICPVLFDKGIAVQIVIQMSTLHLSFFYIRHRLKRRETMLALLSPTYTRFIWANDFCNHQKQQQTIV